MKAFSLYLILLVLLLGMASLASADPGAGLFTGAKCNAANMNATNSKCTYLWTSQVDSELVVLGIGPWKFCFDPDLATDTVGTGTVSLREVIGVTDTTVASHVVNGLVLTGATDLTCIYNIGAGRYWVDAIGDPVAANSAATFEKM